MDDYYKIAALSSTEIRAYINETPLSFWKTTSLNPDRIPWVDTKETIFGRLAHTVVLEAHRINDFYIVLDKVPKKNSKEWKTKYAQSTKEIISTELLETAKQFRDELHKNDDVRAILFNGGLAEQSYYWTQFGLPCKAKIDLCAGNILVDYKTAISIRSDDFGRMNMNSGYYIQAAWYINAYMRMTGETPSKYILIAQSKTYPDDIAIYPLDLPSIMAGAAQCVNAIKEIKQRMASGNWGIHYPNKFETLSLPIWKQMRLEEQGLNLGTFALTADEFDEQQNNYL